MLLERRPQVVQCLTRSTSRTFAQLFGVAEDSDSVELMREVWMFQGAVVELKGRGVTKNSVSVAN